MVIRWGLSLYPVRCARYYWALWRWDRNCPVVYGHPLYGKTRPQRNETIRRIVANYASKHPEPRWEDFQ